MTMNIFSIPSDDEPNEVMLIVVLSTCSQKGDPWIKKHIHEIMERENAGWGLS